MGSIESRQKPTNESTNGEQVNNIDVESVLKTNGSKRKVLNTSTNNNNNNNNNCNIVDNISTVSMALEGGGIVNHNPTKPLRGNKVPPPTSSSSQRGSVYSLKMANPQSYGKKMGNNRINDLNGGHIYQSPNSLGRKTTTTTTTLMAGNMISSNNSDHDSNNNHVPDRGTISSKKPLTSSSSLSNEPSNQLDRSSYGSNTPTLPAETSRPTIRTGAPYSHSAIIEPLNKDHRIEMGLESGKPNNNNNRNANNNKNKRNNNNSYRTSNSIVIIFLLEVIALVLLTVLGYVLHFTDTISVIQRNVHCMDLVQSQIPPEYAESLWFHTVSTRNFQLIYIIGPIILILLIEIIRQLILLGLAHNSQQTSIVQNKLNLSFPIYLRRTIRFIGGFLMGILMNTILVDIVQYQTGMIRPNLLETCPKLADLCRSSVANQLNHSQLTDNCSPADLKRSQMSFPSLTGSLVAYSTLYLILYLWYAMPYRALRFVRIYATLALMATSILTLNTRYLLNQNSLISLCVGSIIGILFALFIVYAHLNAFANRLSTTNVLAANRIASSGRSLSTSNNGNNSASITNEQLFDSSSSISQSNLFADDEKEWFWKSFRIPRVHTFRQSARNMWKRSENLFNNSRTSLSNNNNNGSNQTTMRKNGKSTATTVSSNNAYINPAFNARDDSILANHIHQDSRFSRQDSTPNSNVPNVQYSSTQTRNNQMRTFQA